MKRYLHIFFLFSVFCLLPASCCFSQIDPYWNGWINFSQKYYKIPVTQNGIYRLDSTALSNAGIPVSTIDVRYLQIFFRGQEQYIYIKDQNGNDALNSNDYIEFYGQKNDGSLDSVLYKGDLYNQPVRQPNPYYSLFNDTSMYFLTWNGSAANKRIIDSADTNYSSFSPANYFMKEDISENHTAYYYGRTTTYDINFPAYHESEGWSGSDFYQGSSDTTTFNTLNLYSAASDSVEVKLAVMGANNSALASPNHNLEMKYKDLSGNYVVFDDTAFTGYQLVDKKYKFPASSFGISSSTGIMVTALTFTVSVSSRNTVPYVVMKYPHNMNLESKSYYEMYVPDVSQGKSFYTFTNFSGSNNAYIYDLTNHLKIPMTNSGSDYKVLIPNAIPSIPSAEKFCIVKDESQFLIPSSIKPVNSTGLFTDYSALAVDSAFIIITHKSLKGNPGADAYASYRADGSPAGGGGHNVLVVDIDELYDQFGYGIPKHPFSIRHFAEYCLDIFPTSPKNLFLIGKSIQTDLTRNSGINYSKLLVPSIGYPTCDNMLVSVLNGNLLAPAIPIGRLAAKNISDITIYLQKVKEYEHPSPNPDEWMKHAIHLAGGNNAAQQNDFCNYMRYNLKPIIEDTCFGGSVHVFCKTSSSPTQTSNTDSIRGLINNGVSLITFLGHSSATILDFNLLPVNEYNNANGKYPFFSAAGCLVGDIHQPAGITLSEQEIISTKGMIGFLGSTGPGTPPELKQFNTSFYKHIGHYLYGKSVGKCIQAAIDSTEGTATTNEFMNATLLEMTLHGDPSIIIHASPLPDYSVSTSSVYFTPSYVSTDLDAFDMNVIVTNIGKATNDSVKVDIKRTFVDGTSVSYSDTFPTLYFKDTMTFTLPVDPLHGPGLNKFEVHVDPFDPLDDVLELDDYGNNNINPPNEIPLLIYSGDIIPVYPYKYAIVPNDTIMLKAYTANPFASSVRYIFEIDTTDLFNSRKYKKQYVTQMGAVVKAPYNLWAPDMLILSDLPDSTVYFWRVRRDTTDFVNFRWRESSFQYKSNKRGWGQSHFFQFLKGDKFNYIDTNRIPRYFALDFQSHTILALPGKFSIDGAQQSTGSFLSTAVPHVLISVIDPVTGYIWKNTGFGPYGSYNTINLLNVARYEFETGSPAQQEIVRRFLQDTIPCGYKVILSCYGTHNLGDLLGGNMATTNPGLVQAFQSIGGTQFPNIQNTLPYVLVGKKCGTAVEAIGDGITTPFAIDTFVIKRENGYIYSEIIGPASKWKSMHWRYRSPEEGIDDNLASKDTIKITIIGMKNDGTADTLIKNISKDSLDIYNLDVSISADTFPYLQLQAWVKDSIKRTPAQLTYWRVYYDGVPDASLNPVKGYTFYSPTVQQGDSIKLSVAIENIGDYDMDSLWVDFWVYDSNRYKIPIKSVKLDSLLIDSFLIGDVKFSTLNIPGGLNGMWVEANPFNNQHQLEQYHFNNLGTLPFNVNVDKINPLMDVTFDGVHIMNGDIVSAKPSVLIKLKDENTFLALNDASDFDVRLKRPGNGTYDTIAFGNNLTFEPAVLPNNSCKINYTPALADGTYELKVQAKDRSGNASGKIEYKISFEVINKPTVTNVLNYPNPFSTSTRFVFTLTGSEVPDYFKIQILTITGKIVRDINKYELGHLHIGRNITDYAWDGKDEFGDQLANGLYLYRVLTQLDGKSLEHRESGADSFFTQGFGKMYLIR